MKTREMHDMAELGYTMVDHLAEHLQWTKPRFHGCPEICESENLPMHATREAAMEFHEKNSPGTKVEHIGVCKCCGAWHVRSRARGKHK